MRITLLNLCFLLLPILAFTQKQWTLEECINYTLDNNIDIALQEINIENAALGVKQAKNDFGANINGQFDATQVFGRTIDVTTNTFNTQSTLFNTYGLSGNIELFSGLTRLNSLKKSKLTVEAAILNKDVSEENIQLQLLTTFLGALMAKEQMKQAIQQKANTQQEFDRIKNLIDDGLSAPNDIHLIEAQLASDDIAITNFKNTLAINLADLKIIMRLPPSDSIDIIAPDIPDLSNINESLEPVEYIYKMALGHRPEIKGAAINETLGDYDLKIARGRFYPTISFNSFARTNFSNRDFEFENPLTGEFTRIPADPYFNQFQDNLSYGFGLSVNLPIFNKNLVRLGVAQAKVAKTETELRSEQAKLTLYQNVVRSYNNAVAAIENYNAAVKNEAAAKKALETAESRLDDGLGSNVEFNVANNNYGIATSRLIEAKYNYIFNLKYLDLFKGIPIKL